MKNIHPQWSYSAVLYEMNIRQLTPEGTLRAAEGKLEFLRQMGIDATWLLPIYPIGVEGRKGALDTRLLRHKSRVWHNGGFRFIC